MTIEAALTGFTAAYQALKGAIAARDDALIQKSQLELQEKLLNISMTALSQIQCMHALELEAQKLRTELLEANGKLQEAHRELEKRSAYQIAQPAPGQWARIPVGTDPSHPESTTYFCATCYADGKEIPLQYSKAGPGYSAFLTCPVDKAHLLNLGGALPRPPRRSVTITPNTRW